MKNKLRKTFDYLPFILLVAYSVSEWLTYYVINIQIPFRTYIGLSLLLANALIYIKNHHPGVLLTGLICILGIFNIIMLSPSTSTLSFGSFPFHFGDIYFFVIFIVHVIISFRLYVGIVTKKYWQDLLEKLKGSNDR